MIASSSAASSAYVASASRCTQEIDEPGRMSWNWFSSTAFQIRSRSSYGYASSLPATTAAADHSSASRSRCSLRRLPCLVLACEVYVARWISR